MLYELAALRPPFWMQHLRTCRGNHTRHVRRAASYSNTLHESVRMMLRLSTAHRPSVDQYCRWLAYRLKPDRAPAPEPKSELDSIPGSEHNLARRVLTVDEAPGVDRQGASLEGSAHVASSLFHKLSERHAQGRGGTEGASRYAGAEEQRVSLVHHPWSARHRQPQDDEHPCQDSSVVGEHVSSSAGIAVYITSGDGNPITRARIKAYHLCRFSYEEMRQQIANLCMKDDAVEPNCSSDRSPPQILVHRSAPV